MERKKVFASKQVLLIFSFLIQAKRKYMQRKSQVCNPKSKELRKLLRVVKGGGTEMKLIKRRKKEKDTVEIRLTQ